MAATESASALIPPQQYLDGIADLAVGIGANVQPDQVVAITMQPGQEAITRAVAEASYARGAKYVDVWLFDPYVKHSRLTHAKRDTLSYVPPWLGERTLALGEINAARITFQGPVAPRLMDDVDPALLGLDILPRIRESGIVTSQQLCNWTILPFPNPAWATMVHPELSEADAFTRLWDEVAHICRLDEPDVNAAWLERLQTLEENAERLSALELDSLHYTGPGTDLTIGLLPSSRWIAGRMKTVTGVVHTANIPTEEVFTSPDPTRVDGTVRSTKPLLIPGAAPIEGLTVRFEGGRAVQIDADKGAEILRGMTAYDNGACRLGEVALVDRESRIGRTGTVFYDILLDENAASHLALGSAFDFCVDTEEDRARVNQSGIHIDFMIGSNELLVDGIKQDGTVVPLLRDGAWQV